jgi:hypothetical protein
MTSQTSIPFPLHQTWIGTHVPLPKPYRCVFFLPSSSLDPLSTTKRPPSSKCFGRTTLFQGSIFDIDYLFGLIARVRTTYQETGIYEPQIFLIEASIRLDLLDHSPSSVSGTTVAVYKNSSTKESSPHPKKRRRRTVETNIRNGVQFV